MDALVLIQFRMKGYAYLICIPYGHNPVVHCGKYLHPFRDRFHLGCTDKSHGNPADSLKYFSHMKAA